MSDVKRYYVGINTKCIGGIGLVEMTDLYREATGFDGLVMGEDYDTLKAENERLERNRDMWKGQVERQSEGMDVMRKDAERYRWLRDGADYCDTRDIPGMAPARMDAFIDAALSRGEQS